MQMFAKVFFRKFGSCI